MRQSAAALLAFAAGSWRGSGH